MSRTKTIDYRRMTFSLPVDLVDDLRLNIEKNKMSSYLADLARKDLALRKNQKEEVDDFIESMRKFRKENKPVDARSSIEILREIRYGGK